MKATLITGLLIIGLSFSSFMFNNTRSQSTKKAIVPLLEIQSFEKQQPVVDTPKTINPFKLAVDTLLHSVDSLKNDVREDSKDILRATQVMDKTYNTLIKAKEEELKEVVEEADRIEVNVDPIVPSQIENTVLLPIIIKETVPEDNWIHKLQRLFKKK